MSLVVDHHVHLIAAHAVARLYERRGVVYSILIAVVESEVAQYASLQELRWHPFGKLPFLEVAPEETLCPMKHI